MKINIRQILFNRVARNAGWLIGGKIIQMLINFVVGLITARYLGPENYGLINYASAYTAFFFCFCNLGINSVIVKEFIDHPGEEGQILGTTIGLRMISSLLSAGTIIAISFVLDAGEPVTKMVVVLTSIGLLFQVFETFNYWFQSQLHSKTTAIATLIAYLVTACYKVVLLIAKKPVTYFAFATSLDSICFAAILYFCYRREHRGKLSFSESYGKELLKKSYHFILPSLMVAIYGQTDKIMLKQMIDATEIGYYSTAVSICNIWCFVLSAIIDSMYPPIMEAFKRDKAEFDRKNKLLYAIVFYVSTLVSVLFMIFGKLAIRILYGEAYMPSVMPLRIITWYTSFSYLGVARTAWIVCKEKQKYLKYIYLTAAISNVGLNLIFIPMWGASGAAVASLIAQILTIVVPFFIKDMRENSVLILKAILFR